MPMNIAIASLMQESNSFAPRQAALSDFATAHGPQMRPLFEGTNSELGGFLEACEARNWRAVLLTSAHASSGGPLSDECFESLIQPLLTALAAQPVDGVLLALHGAMATVSRASGDAEICRRVRAAVGPRVPIVVTHDLHANVSPSLLGEVDGLSGYRTYPHVDQRDTAMRAARLLDRLLDGETGVHWQLRTPMLIPPQAGSTFEEPLAPLIGEMTRLFPESGPVCPSPFFVQPWLDLDAVSGCFTATGFDEADADVPRHLLALGRQLWEMRWRFAVDWVTEENLIDRVRAESRRPVIVSEAHDSPSGGAAGDHTGLLRCLLPHADEFRGCLFLIDPETARRAAEAGVGATMRLTVGAKEDARFSSPVPLTATVEHVSSGEFVFKGPAFHGLRQSIGTAAVLAVGRLRILVGSRAVYVIDPELFRSQGIEPAEMDIVGVKSPTLFRAAYDEISRAILYLDMPGVCRARFEALPFRRIQRPMFPLDDFDWKPGISDVRCVRPGAKANDKGQQ